MLMTIFHFGLSETNKIIKICFNLLQISEQPIIGSCKLEHDHDTKLTLHKLKKFKIN